MAKVIREYQIRPMVCGWALDIPMGNTTFVLHFNSRNNAELVKAILEWEDSHPNEAIPYQPTLTLPNEPLTPKQLREMNEPVWCSCKPIEGGNGYWCLCRYGKIVTPSGNIFDVDKIPHWMFYRRPPEGEADA